MQHLPVGVIVKTIAMDLMHFMAFQLLDWTQSVLLL
jgi:hypothetical protein